MGHRFTALQSLILFGSMLLGGCAQAGQGSGTSVQETTAAVTQAETTEAVTETTPSPTPTPAVYDFTWEKLQTEEFSRIVNARYGTVNLKEYIVSYGGFDQELQEMFTAYVNYHYGKEYETVPFSTVNWFRMDLFKGLSSAYKLKNNYKNFSNLYLNKNAVDKSSFKNKLVMSYLIQNNIPFGQRIPTANLMQIRENIDISKYSTKPYLKNKKKLQTGNFNSSYQYSSEDLLTVLTYYNRSISNICLDYRVMDFVIGTDEQKFAEDGKELTELCNGYLAKHYGDNAPQIGKTITKDQYTSMFGEEPLDLSYIQGGVFDQSKNTQKAPFTADTGNEGIKEKIICKWTNKSVKGISYTIEFRDDNTGTFTTVRNTRNYNTKKLTKKTTTVDFTYKIKFGTMIDIVFSNGVREAFFYRSNTVTRLYLYTYYAVVEIRKLDFKKAK